MLTALQGFRSKLQQARGGSGDEEPSQSAEAQASHAGDEGDIEKEGMDIDDDVDWINHRLRFADDDNTETMRAEHDYEVIDPRARSAKAKEQEKERKKERSRKDGGRGYSSRPSYHHSRR